MGIIQDNNKVDINEDVDRLQPYSGAAIIS